MDQELQVVLSDLDYLYDEWDQDIADDSLRRNSVVLRRLLVNGELLRVWRNTGFQQQPEIIAPSLSEHLKVIPVNSVGCNNRV